MYCRIIVTVGRWGGSFWEVCRVLSRKYTTLFVILRTLHREKSDKNFDICQSTDRTSKAFSLSQSIRIENY